MVKSRPLSKLLPSDFRYGFPTMRKQLKADLGLLSVTVFWGSTFILSKLTLLEIPLLLFLDMRLGTAAVILDVIALKQIRLLSRKTLLHGAALGLFLYLSYFFQMWGIQYTTASNAGFITGLSVVMVPIFSYLIFRVKPSFNVAIGIVLAVIGLFLLTGADLFSFNSGDFLVLICAVTVAFHIIYTGKFAPQHHVLLLTAVQLTVVALLSVLALLFYDFSQRVISDTAWWVVLYLAVFGTVYPYLMQTHMQRFTTTTRTALIFAMEPVFAALFAFIVAKESLELSSWFGGFLIVLGMIFSELPVLPVPLTKNYRQWKSK